MAHTSTARRPFGAVLGAFGVSAVAAAALVGMAGTAGAHTPSFKAECVSSEGVTTLEVSLRAYQDAKQNTVTVTDGDKVLVETEFGENFEQSWNDLDATVDHTFTLDVQAWDDPEGTKGWSFSSTIEVGACVQPTTPPEEPAPTTEPSQPVEEPTSEPAPPSAEPVETTEPSVEEATLAETGASVALPIGIGAVLLAGGVVLMIVVRRRGRA